MLIVATIINLIYSEETKIREVKIIERCMAETQFKTLPVTSKAYTKVLTSFTIARSCLYLKSTWKN